MSNPAETPSPAATTAPAQNKGPVRRVLCVDDDPLQRRLACEVLARAGLHAECAADGAEVAGRTDLDQFDLVISDHAMPRLDGLGLVASLRNSAYRGVIIILTSGVEPQEAALYRALGVKTILRKPLPPQALIEAVRQVDAQAAVAPEAARSTEPAEDGRLKAAGAKVGGRVVHPGRRTTLVAPPADATMPRAVFAEIYCAARQIDSSRFSARLYRETLPFYARWLALLPLWLRPEQYRADFDFIADVATVKCYADYEIAVAGYRWHPQNGGVWGRVLHLRISVSRMNRVVGPILHTSRVKSSSG